jgi:hypothetical protein
MITISIDILGCNPFVKYENKLRGGPVNRPTTVVDEGW